ncbi:MAG: YeeE/YedE thiosulfate transporter family protein, partial [Gemmobacter sp.]
LVVLALAAHATMKGLLAPLRSGLASVTMPLGDFASLAALPGGATGIALAGAAAALWFALHAGTGLRGIAGGTAIGLLVPLAWIGTGFVLRDDFDPIALEALAFTGPHADTLFWAITATAVAPTFGIGLILGTLAGGAGAAILSGRFAWVGFSTPRETGRYLAGGMLMGVGGVLAGGCTVGAGLSGVSTLSSAAGLALAAIVAGALATDRLLSAWTAESGARATTPRVRQAA